MRWVALCTVLAGCVLATTPEEAERNDLPDDRDGDELHRPGQPCLLCHDFALAGTIYRRADDAIGVEGAQIRITDADGRELTARSNRAGNFFVDVGSGGRGRPGQLRVPFEPTFPVSIEISLGDLEQTMESYAWRDGSCAGCHTGTSDTRTSVRKIFLVDDEVAP